MFTILVHIICIADKTAKMHVVVKITEDTVSYYYLMLNVRENFVLRKHFATSVSEFEAKYLQCNYKGMGGRWGGRKDVQMIGQQYIYLQSLFARPLSITHRRLLRSLNTYLGYTIVRWWHTVCDRLHIVDQGRALLAVRNGASQIRSGRSVGASGTTLLSGRARRCRCCCRPHFRK